MAKRGPEGPVPRRSPRVRLYLQEPDRGLDAEPKHLTFAKQLSRGKRRGGGGGWAQEFVLMGMPRHGQEQGPWAEPVASPQPLPNGE